MKPAPNPHQITNTCTNTAETCTNEGEDNHFTHLGRRYRLYKRVEGKLSPYYFHFEHNRERHQKCLETPIKAAAVTRAKRFIDLIRSEKWDDIEKLKGRRTSATLADVFKLYPQYSLIGEETAHNNMGAMLLVVACCGDKPAPENVSLTELTPLLISKYQAAMVARYCKTASEDPDSQREARERALRSSRSTVNQARSLFNKRTRLVQQYDAAGLKIPDNIEEFMTCSLEGKMGKKQYFAPPDAVVEQAFTKVEELKDTDPNAYLAFWFAAGAGLRRSEIHRMRWDYLVERDGSLWISGGIGKDGQQIEVPVQARAAEVIRKFRKPEGQVIEGETCDCWARRLNFWMMHNGWGDTEKKMHELRAYVGSLIYRKSPTAAMAFMRHKSIRVTEQFYCRYGTAMKPVDVL